MTSSSPSERTAASTTTGIGRSLASETVSGPRGPDRRHVIRDLLHGYISLDDSDRAILDCRYLQRLRYIRQNDLRFLVYPSLNTTRLEHSLGVFHIAGQIASSALANGMRTQQYLDELAAMLPSGLEMSEPMEAAFIRAARWYGLLHDVGHLPLSHLGETAAARLKPGLYGASGFSKLHESAGAWIIENDQELRAALERHPVAAWLVRSLMTDKAADPLLQPLKDIVDSDVDADRIDATARDGRQSGGDFGHYDIARLARDAVLFEHDGRWRVSFTTRAVGAVEALLVERYKTHRWIHFQPKAIAISNAFIHCAMSTLKDEDWHARAYFQPEGYFDDSQALSRAVRIPSDAPAHLRWARDALLWRKRSALPLWKRRDDFRALGDRVAKRDGRFEAYNEKKPVLNILAPEASVLERELNRDADEEVRYLVHKATLEPFSGSLFDEEIAEFLLLSHRDLKPVLLTDESRLVGVLRTVVEQEPGFQVTLVGPPDRLAGDQEPFLDHFVERAAGVLMTLWRGRPA